MKQIARLILIMVFANSCVKQDGVTCAANCITLKGNVKEMLSGKAISEFQLRLSGNFRRRNGTIGCAKTDANGNYNFKFDATQLLAEKSNLTITPILIEHVLPTGNNLNLTTIEIDSLDIGTEITRNFQLLENATLKVKVKNKIKRSFYSSSISYTYPQSKSGFGVGIDLDTSKNLKVCEKIFVPANVPVFLKIECKAFPSINSVIKADTLIVKPNSKTTCEFEI